MKSILFADDNRSIREFCKDQLESAGYNVVLARNGVEATQLVASNRIDLAILDIKMPIMNGYQAAARIKSIDPSLPIMFFTGHVENPGELRDGPAILRVTKGQDLSELKSAVARLLAAGDGRRLADSAGE